MDKEKLITIAIGLAVGIAIAASYFIAVKFLPRLTSPNTAKVTYNPSANETSQNPKNLSVDKPNDNSVSTDDQINVSGKAPAGTKILIFANADEKIASADASGNFTASLKLEDGENEITFNTLSGSRITETIKRSVILEVKP